MLFLFTIDPSINSCGVALHIDKELAYYELITSKKGLDFAQKSNIILDKINSFVLHYIKLYDIDTKDILVVYEIPEYWGVSGYAARESGNLNKLTFLCGLIESLNKKYHVEKVTPTMWKGQWSKSVLKNRLVKIYTDINFDTIKHDVIDAIGIGWHIVSSSKKNEDITFTDLRVKWFTQN